MSNFKIPRLEDDLYLKWVRTLPCICCNSQFKSEAHHRIGAGRVSTMKTDDYECIPLCQQHHAELHDKGWRTFEAKWGVQSQMVVETLLQAIRQEVLAPNVHMLKRMAKYDH